MFAIRYFIAFNIVQESRKPTLEDVITAAKLANAHEFVMGMPNGYQTEVGEKVYMVEQDQKLCSLLLRLSVCCIIFINI